MMWNNGLSDPDNKTSKEQQVVKRMDNVRDCTVADLADWCFQRRIDPSDVTITATHLKWESLETAEERDRRLEWWEETQERQLKWEREAWERLREKYGDGE